MLDVVLSVLGTLVVLWVAGMLLLWWRRPADLRLGDALRLLPDVIGLVRRLAGDTSLPRGVRIRIWLLVAYLAMPIDLVPDFVPVLGQADDVILVALVLRSVVRRAGPAAVERHWRGGDAGLAVVRRLARA
ncbi:MAG: YkvA family protein [Aeromicrobium sp.]